jgi:hypothetical protein
MNEKDMSLHLASLSDAMNKTDSCSKSQPDQHSVYSSLQTVKEPLTQQDYCTA